jgi:hypothetical protein
MTKGLFSLVLFGMGMGFFLSARLIANLPTRLVASLDRRSPGGIGANFFRFWAAHSSPTVALFVWRTNGVIWMLAALALFLDLWPIRPI